MNSFGYGGTNAHVVLAEPGDAATTDGAPELPAAHVETATDPLLLVSARSPEALRELAGKHAEALADPDVDVASYCRSAAIHRSHHRLRTSFPASDRSSLIDSLTEYSAEEPDAGRTRAGRAETLVRLHRDGPAVVGDGPPALPDGEGFP